MQPFTLAPRPVVRVWGGSRLQEIGLCPPSSEPLGECWAVFGELPVADGPLRGRTLDQLVEHFGTKLLGRWSDPQEKGFPLLTKWLDCRDWLSIQVHPDDAVARQLTGDPEQRGKSEAWYFHQVDPQGQVIHGWSQLPPVEDQLRKLEGADWLPLVRRYRPQPGSWVHTPPGTIHALGPGLLVFEVQQSSDLTYRVYDWDRPGLDGSPRPLHRQEALEAVLGSRPEMPPETPPGLLGAARILTPYFCVEEVTGERTWEPGGDSFELLTALNYTLNIDCGGQGWKLSPGSSLVVPATAPKLTCQAPPEARWFRVRSMPGRN